MRSFSTKEEGSELGYIADVISPPPVVLEPAAQGDVLEIVWRVFDERDEAVVEYSSRDWPEASASTLRVAEDELKAAREGLDQADAEALRAAIDRVREFHEKQVPGDHMDAAEYGALLGWRYTPIESVGVYVPAGTAPLPSSLIMAVVPAQVAGVSRIAVVTPPGRDGGVNPGILAAAGLLGITELYRVGGPWAIAALARGTESIPAVDKIVGPGNIYVNFAKSAVAGVVGVDGFYGPSEVVILADEHAEPRLVAADLIAQAEHGADSLAVLVTPSSALIEAVKRELERSPVELRRADIVQRSLEERAAAVLVRDLDEGIELVNLLAPEHLELMVADPQATLAKIRNAGCILIGGETPTAVSDYLAGPSHILPTGRSARFSSGLGVLDFMKRSSVVSVTPEWLRRNGPQVERLARMEGLQAHARSVRMRMGDDG
jgi:histidinol dehydrogenase